MLKKEYRLSEKEVKKVLMQKKPFFSYGIVLNTAKNILGKNRFGIVISSKSVENNVNRVFFRRFFYNLVYNLTDRGQFDAVFVVKKDVKLEKNDEKSIQSFENDVKFLIKKWQETVKK